MYSSTMTLITKSKDVASVCQALRDERYVTVDTEFMRDSTYWPKLCLVQLGGTEGAWAIDALAEGLDLQPLIDLMADESVLKVFHAGRQDVEIFYHMAQTIPTPIFDTQIAAMVCGFGEAISYDKVVSRLAGVQIDKSTRFADWARRPLSDKQIDYALGDVTHLRVVYERLAESLEKNDRSSWLVEEIDTLTDPASYKLDPETAWLRLKVRSGKPRFLGTVKMLAAWREREAQRRDVPRNRVIRDDVLLDIAASAPRTPEDLAKSRSVGKGLAEGKSGRGILQAIDDAFTMAQKDLPYIPKKKVNNANTTAVVELLKVLLKQKSEQHGVAAKLIATSSELDELAGDDAADIAALRGWRHEIFGTDALRLKHGEIALRLKGDQVRIVSLD